MAEGLCDEKIVTLQPDRYALSVNLVIDQGNSSCKLAVFDGGELRWFATRETLRGDILSEAFERYTSIDAVIYSDVGWTERPPLEDFNIEPGRMLLRLTPETPVPLRVDYQRQGLGGDRLAAAVGAHSLVGDEGRALVIDAGTAITYEYLGLAGCYQGGNISPGLGMRFRALSTFTSRLPLIEDWAEVAIGGIGHTTQGAISIGVVEGLVREMRSYIHDARQADAHMRVLLTGGDAPYLLQQLPMQGLEHVPHLVLTGLNSILEYNKKIR